MYSILFVFLIFWSYAIFISISKSDVSRLAASILLELLCNKSDEEDFQNTIITYFDNLKYKCRNLSFLDIEIKSKVSIENFICILNKIRFFDVKKTHYLIINFTNFYVRQNIFPLL